MIKITAMVALKRGLSLTRRIPLTIFNKRNNGETQLSNQFSGTNKEPNKIANCVNKNISNLKEYNFFNRLDVMFPLKSFHQRYSCHI